MFHGETTCSYKYRAQYAKRPKNRCCGYACGLTSDQGLVNQRLGVCECIHAHHGKAVIWYLPQSQNQVAIQVLGGNGRRQDRPADHSDQIGHQNSTLSNHTAMGVG